MKNEITNGKEGGLSIEPSLLINRMMLDRVISGQVMGEITIHRESISMLGRSNTDRDLIRKELDVMGTAYNRFYETQGMGAPLQPKHEDVIMGLSIYAKQQIKDGVGTKQVSSNINIVLRGFLLLTPPGVRAMQSNLKILEIMERNAKDMIALESRSKQAPYYPGSAKVVRKLIDRLKRL